MRFATKRFDLYFYFAIGMERKSLKEPGIKTGRHGELFFLTGKNFAKPLGSLARYR